MFLTGKHLVSFYLLSVNIQAAFLDENLVPFLSDVAVQQYWLFSAFSIF